jgi:hypothetical protein
MKNHFTAENHREKRSENRRGNIPKIIFAVLCVSLSLSKAFAVKRDLNNYEQIHIFVKQSELT